MKKLVLFILTLNLIGQTVQSQQCTSNPNGWQPFTATIAKYPAMTENCGHQFVVAEGVAFKLKGKYICNGNCTAKFTAVLKNIATDTVEQNYPEFSFPWKYTFTSAGNYKLEFYPQCGDKKCQPCRFFFTVK